MPTTKARPRATSEAKRPRKRTPSAQNAARVTPITPSMGEIGGTGTPIFSRAIMPADYNPELNAPACYDVYDRMRMGDGQVRAALAAVKLPILRAFWQVEPASDSAEDREIAEFCDTDLDSMAIPFISYLRQALLHLDYGSMPFEKCWSLGADRRVHLTKLAPRLPRTIVEWQVDDNGGLTGVKQGAFTGDRYREVTIPAEKLLLFVNDQEGSNYRGVSILRAAYKHWYYKDGFYKIDAIAKEKRGVGVDVGVIKAEAQDKTAIKAALEPALMTLHAHEKQYFVEDEENYTYRLETGGDSLADALGSIEHHDLRILRSILVEMLAMGAGSTGSLAMHKDKSAFFLMTLEAIADVIAEEMTTNLIRPWVDYNWRVTAYPRFKYSRLDTRDFAALAAAVSALVGAGALTPTFETEAEIRVVGDLPAIAEADYVGGEPAPADDLDVDDAVAEAVRVVQSRQLARLKLEAARMFGDEPGKSLDEIVVPFRRKLAEIIGSRARADLLSARLKVAFDAEIERQKSAGAYDEGALERRLAVALV